MNIWNVRNDLKEMDLDGIKSDQISNSLPFACCALNVTGDLNVGMLMRTASIVGAERFLIFGRRKYDKRSTVGCHNYIPNVRVTGIDENGNYDVKAFYDLMEFYEYIPVFVEQGGTYLDHHNPLDLPGKPCYIVGNEGEGIPDNLIGNSMRVSLRQRGVMRSFNVAAAGSILMYEISERFGASKKEY